MGLEKTEAVKGFQLLITSVNSAAQTTFVLRSQKMPIGRIVGQFCLALNTVLVNWLLLRVLYSVLGWLVVGDRTFSPIFRTKISFLVCSFAGVLCMWGHSEPVWWLCRMAAFHGFAGHSQSSHTSRLLSGSFSQRSCHTGVLLPFQSYEGSHSILFKMWVVQCRLSSIQDVLLLSLTTDMRAP